ncbi:MAG: acyl-CoA dehydrogenase [Steroidobacteraceae bacterium]
MSGIIWLLALIIGGFYLAYQRVSLLISTLLFGAGVVAYTLLGGGSLIAIIPLWLVLAVLLLLNIDPLRIRLISRPFLRTYRRMLPSMSSTEADALAAGTVWWDGELFSGAPKWEKLLGAAPPKLTAEEQAFIDGPTETLCRMIDDWDITHRRADMSPEVWAYIRQHGFFAMVIGKQYGGLGFSAYAHSCVLIKIASKSATVSSTVCVPNSLGPGELLTHYGTEEQKDYYLPRLARGEEIPCFALTGPRAGSDAASLPDIGVVCKGMYNGQEIVGINLNFNKRYITLAPVATLVGLAFQLRDPDKLLGGEQTDYGITCALIPRNTAGIRIGRRHFPLNTPFQNGPIFGKDVFVPLDFIIGGPKMAGQGWRMLVEQLSVGRCISLPSNATGSALAAAYASGAYCRIRRQFNLPIGQLEGVQEVLARLTGMVYIMNAARSVTVASLDAGERPAVPSTILKYSITEMSRKVANDAMDVQGGKGICLGPKNYLGRGYQSVPIAITVEGANILTRTLMIFGQGAIRCHPFVLKEMNAARDKDKEKGVRDFDQALFAHIGFTISNAIRSLVMATTLARFSSTPDVPDTKRYYQQINRFSASFAFAADVAMLGLGGYLKKKEMLSGRLADVLSYMYLASTVLKHYESQGRQQADLPLVEWACRHLLYNAQEQLHGLLRNFPNRMLAGLMRMVIFPRGRTYFAPGDKLGAAVANSMLSVTDTRARLSDGIYKTIEPGNALGLLQQALSLSEVAEPLERRVRVEGVKTGKITALELPLQIDEALAMGILNSEEAATLHDYDQKVMELINVDDFDPRELAPHPETTAANMSLDDLLRSV